ncbi:hypothetical protein CVT25_010846 [Psilocybe cyanescens]|uniref:Ubiquitin-like-conjugating enzyme ATG10 n=1 Tax=Psilocybe cyanescens TaxID=93625 RepID=A0A409WFF9_PSICY|nr:hypothetical protein CVT25_010846 [Psilocybe cyanescens]
MLSRSDFVLACRAFARRHPHWSWADGHRTGYGYLTRTSTHVFKIPQYPSTMLELEGEDEVGLETDDPASAHPAPAPLTVQEFIVYSASFSVPAFYFTIHDTNGTPLSLNEILQTSLFKMELPGGSEATSFALSFPSLSFPVLSQGEHPTLGTPCWYFHPCETDAAVGEFLAEVEQSDWNEETRHLRWMELWLMIVGAVVNL